MTTQQYRELIQKYIRGNCTAAEKRVVATLLADPAYQAFFEEILEEKGNPLEASEEEPDEQMLHWTAKIQDRINEQQRPKRLLNASFYKYAAIWMTALLTLGGLGYLTYRGDKTVQITYVDKLNDGHQLLRMVLADSSIIFIGPGSKISYPEVFAADNREVSLEGEAFFDIKTNPDAPFIVRSGNIRTEVLGTSFKVSAFPGKPATVAVATGKVRVSEAMDSAMTELALLSPGRQLVYTNGKTTLSETSIVQLEGWQKGKLIYRDTPLGVITADLERWHGVEVRYTNLKRADLLLNINYYAASPLENTLRLIAATGNITYQIKGKTIIIR